MPKSTIAFSSSQREISSMVRCGLTRSVVSKRPGTRMARRRIRRKAMITLRNVENLLALIRVTRQYVGISPRSSLSIQYFSPRKCGRVGLEAGGLESKTSSRSQQGYQKESNLSSFLEVNFGRRASSPESSSNVLLISVGYAVRSSGGVHRNKRSAIVNREGLAS